MGKPCRSLFALALMHCPHCGSTDYHQHGTRPGDTEYHWMPKITRSTGATGAVETTPAQTIAEDVPTDDDIAAVETVKAKSANEILAEVDGDPKRAFDALNAEQASDQPRKTLVAKLERILADATDPEPDDGAEHDETADEGPAPDAG